MPFNITGIYDHNLSSKDNSCCFFIVINHNILLLIDSNKSDFVSDTVIKNFIEKNKIDSKFKSVKYEYDNNPNSGKNYICLFNQDGNKNPRIMWKFFEKILTFKFRPNQKMGILLTYIKHFY